MRLKKVGQGCYKMGVNLLYSGNDPRMKVLYSVLFLVLTSTIQAQINEDLTPEERAYLYHIVKKSPILDNNFGRYVDYIGPEITFANKQINYDSVELIIINHPEMLMIRKEEIAKSPKGLIAEAANKMAVWELNKVLLAKRSSPKDLKQYENEYARFERYLLEKLPPNAIKESDGTMSPQNRIDQVLNPMLSFDEKMTQLESMRFLDQNDQIVTLEAINFAINHYVEHRAYEIFNALGGECDSFKNILVAAGDGSNTSGLLEEREKDEKGRWNKGLPKAVGLFPYQVKLETFETGKEHITIDGAHYKKTATRIEPARTSFNTFHTAGGNKFTNVHFDVWGYNSEKQTTVVVEKNGLNYHLFGSGETRFLSPDSTFDDGATFQSIINDLEFNKIAKLYDMIYGKKGFDYWIEYNQKKKDGTELKIEKLEKEYSDLGYSPITTSKKAPGSVKRSKKKAIKGNTGSFDGTPKTSSNRKERKKLQNEIVHAYDLFEAYKRKIAELEKEKAEAIDLMAIYKIKLDEYKRWMGHHWASYEEKDGLYIFEDSTTFDILTQEFRFKPSKESEAFEVRLIAIPESSISKSADEVMLHINVMDAEPHYDARINLSLEDVFESDKWDLSAPLFTEDDSVAIRVFFEGLLDTKVDFNIIARGQGIGKWNGISTEKDPAPVELSSYPGNSAESRFDSTYVRLRKSEVFIHIDREITMTVNSYTDPVQSSMSVDNETLKSMMEKYRLSKNDLLSVLRTASILKALKKELNVMAGTYLTREEASSVIDRFNKTIDKARISVGTTSVKMSSL